MKNILWIHVDGFRFDTKTIVENYLGEELQGFNFLDTNFSRLDNCYTHALTTIYSFAGYMTGTLPSKNTSKNNDEGTVSKDIKWLGEILRSVGFKSKAVFTTGPQHDNNFLRLDIKDRAFDEIEFLHGTDYDGQVDAKKLAMQKFKEIVTTLNKSNNFFYYITLLDMHGRDGRGLDGYIDEYSAAATRVNYFLKLILANVDFDKTIVVVHGDHGWKFDFDHSKYNAYCDFYGFCGYEPLSHVACYISSGLLGHHLNKCNIIDIIPTILDILNVEVDSEMFDGQSLIKYPNDHVVHSYVKMPISEQSFPPIVKYFTKETNDEQHFPLIPKSNMSILKNGYQLVLHSETFEYLALFKYLDYSKSLLHDGFVDVEQFNSEVDLIKTYEAIYKGDRFR